MPRTRRNNNQMLTDVIADLYKRVELCIKEAEDARLVVEDVFDAIKPLRELEDQYRSNHGIK